MERGCGKFDGIAIPTLALSRSGYEGLISGLKKGPPLAGLNRKLNCERTDYTDKVTEK